MKTKNDFFLIGIIVLFLISCETEKETVEYIPKFEGISYFNEEGKSVGPIDTSDWRIDDYFSKIEQSLFSSIDFNDLSNVNSTLGKSKSTILTTKKDSVVVFFPNPVNTMGLFIFDNTSTSKMHLKIVDSTFTILSEFQITNKEVALNFENYENGIFRIYYVFQDSAHKITGMGHGDIQIE